MLINKCIERELNYQIKKRLENLEFEVTEGDGWFELDKKERKWSFELGFHYDKGLFMMAFESSDKWLFLRKTVARIVIEEMKLLEIDSLLMLDLEAYEIQSMFEEASCQFPAIATGEKANYLLTLVESLDVHRGYRDYWYKICGSNFVNVDTYLKFTWGRDPRVDMVYCEFEERKKVESSLNENGRYVIEEFRLLQDIVAYKQKIKEKTYHIWHGERTTQVSTSSGRVYIKETLDPQPFIDFGQQKWEELQQFAEQIKNYIRQKDGDVIFFEEPNVREGKMNIVCNFLDNIENIFIYIDTNSDVLRHPSEMKLAYDIYGSFKIPGQRHEKLEIIYSVIKNALDEAAKGKRLPLLYDADREGAIPAMLYEFGFRGNQKNIICTTLRKEEINQALKPYYLKGGRIVPDKKEIRFERIESLLIFKKKDTVIIEKDPEKLLNWLFK